MNPSTTSLTLLGRLRSRTDEAAWQRFADLYSPVIYVWATRSGLTNEAALDLLQETLLVLLKKLPTFQYDPEKGRFRGWLKTVVLNSARDMAARRLPVTQDPATLVVDVYDPPGFWENEYSQLVLERAFEIMRSEFEETTWRACWKHVTTQRSAREIGEDLGLTEAAVFAAKSRVLRRLREEFRGLLD